MMLRHTLFLANRREFRCNKLQQFAHFHSSRTTTYQHIRIIMLSLATWHHGLHPNHQSFTILESGGTALDAVERGASSCEGDLTCMSVGRGGLPDAEGIVTLDASIMDHQGRCGSVAFVQNYLDVTTLARAVMERTPHVMLAGAGAERFAAELGMKPTDLLTAKSAKLYAEWKSHPDKINVRLRRVNEGDHEYSFEYIDPSQNAAVNESHDTIGLIAMDEDGRLAGACTTSGLAFKMHGRVGDSPIIGSGLFVDGKVAAAVATGNGELVMRGCSTFHIVEQIRQGVEPGEACERALDRIRQQTTITDDMQVGLLVIRADGVWSARSLRPGFQFAACDTPDGNQLYDCSEEGYSLVRKDG